MLQLKSGKHRLLLFILSALLLFGNEGVFAAEVGSKGTFDSTAWKALGVRGNYDRTGDFHKFLEAYNLIGMSYEDVESLMGKESSCAYSKKSSLYALVSGPCGNSAQYLKIEFQNNKVSRWKQYAFEDEEKGLEATWFDKNMIWTKAGYQEKK